jgi:hypothetical protein
MTPVALALILAIDVSGSVNAVRYELQRHGVAEAFRSPDVQQAIWQAGPNGIAIAVVEWSDTRYPVVPWRIVATPDDLVKLADDIDAVKRTSLGPTHIGEAIIYAVSYFGECSCEPLRRVVDVSGDGVSNGGRPVPAARDAAVEAGVIINGLPILEGGDRDLEAHYRTDVIGGFGAFVRVAATWGDFGTAISEKLRLEIAGLGAAPFTVAMGPP